MSAPVVITFGELLLRLDTPGHERFEQANQFRATYTGGEANVAVALSQWGVKSRIVSRVPPNALGEACCNQLRRYGVDTAHVARGGTRLGLLFVETGAGPRPPQVLYDREHSAFRELRPVEIDWDGLFANAGWFHFTGTAPAVGPIVRETLVAALQQARARGLPVSLDCSYRSALWPVAEASRELRPLLDYVDIFLGSESDLAQFFDVRETGATGVQRFREQYNLSVVALAERTTRDDGVPMYTATVTSEAGSAHSRTYELTVVDRIGAGDAFAAGVIRGWLQNHPLSQLVEFAAAAAVLKHTIPGDFALLSVAEVERLAAGESTGRGWR